MMTEQKYNYFELDNGRAFGFMDSLLTEAEFLQYLAKNEPHMGRFEIVKKLRNGAQGDGQG